MAEVEEIKDSVLITTKNALGIVKEYTVFDDVLIMHINSVFNTLNQLGVGPPAGFRIEDDKTTWDDYLGEDLNLNSVKSYMYLRVRLLFDLPATSFAITAFKEQIKELEWRLQVQADPPVEYSEEDG